MHAPAPHSSLVEDLARDRLRWFPEIGVGFFPVADPAAPYDESYFDKYRGYQATELGRALTHFRVEFVNRHAGAERNVIDFGIGCGDFIETRDELFKRRNTFGFDINPRAIGWLEQWDRLINPWRVATPALTMFDSLEHVEDFRPLLANVVEWLFVSIPIWRGDGSPLIERWRHYRTDEHFWYFTDRGFSRTMALCGFEIVETSARETELGRESILTYALRRSKNAVGSFR